LKKNIAIVILVVLLVVGGGFAFFRITGRELPFGLGNVLGGGGGEGGSSQGFIGKIGDALKVGTAMKCTFSEEGVNATFYLKNGKLRGEMTSATGDEKINYILRDNCMYYWSESEKQGFKWCWEESEAEDWEKNLAEASESYDCKPQTVSDSMFSLPSGIEFADMTDYMNQGAE